jgi:hypothetical protein
MLPVTDLKLIAKKLSVEHNIKLMCLLDFVYAVVGIKTQM